MYLVDSHCHLHDREFFTEEQAEQMLKNARTRGVKQIICIGTSHEDSLNAQKFAESHDDVFWTYGIHPEEAEASFELIEKNPTKFSQARNEASVSSSLVGIGEVGLDYHHPNYDRTKQIKLLEEMLDLAVKLNLPCSFHVRDAFDDFFAVIKNFTFEARLKPSVLHSFTDTTENFYKAIEVYNLYIGINGIATFANLDFLKDDRLNAFFVRSRCLLETDAPFLTPAPNRGKINEPANVADVATWLAKKFEISEAEVAEWTSQNARTVFNLPNPESDANPRAELS
ncbi:TatD family hydrolase [Candidatus Saccharibacteria bacterium]|nr:TatD family hydrolase [Candidatus Saccharibacteria bacterium]